MLWIITWSQLQFKYFLMEDCIGFNLKEFVRVERGCLPPKIGEKKHSRNFNFWLVTAKIPEVAVQRPPGPRAGLDLPEPQPGAGHHQFRGDCQVTNCKECECEPLNQ